ncbi:transporter substrate-binding domain-containing protein [Shewanella electrodiphila]|uniref:Transporter substrate-binding domain-containing protein n=1 Tax=Shewanella electrodiphila TaxID=934143 RepID=A0ABT0KV17_9GAMM|nr:transporter substrate-binding domain-containing protein [Shewanella electrodiphila]MCL1047685.1 transporter substrate-binding domain-containing protein [Shewanella electrodiphila]
MKILIICFVGFFSSNIFAETFTAHCRNYPPELFFENGECKGAIPEMMTDIFTELGHQINWENVPWIRSMKEAESGRVDLLIRHSMTEARQVFLYPIAYGYNIRNLTFYKSPRLDVDITSYKELENYRVGAIRGVFYSLTFSTIESRELTLVGRTQQLLGMLERDRIDVAVTSASHSIELFDEHFEKITLVDTFENPLYVSIPKKSKAAKLHADVAKLISEYGEMGKINQYFERYGLEGPKPLKKSEVLLQHE